MLKDFYKSENVTEDRQITLEKDILLTVPSADFDIKPILERLGLSRYEVAVTYPKEGVDMLAEVCAVESELFIQVGEKFFDEYLFMPDDGSQDENLRAEVALTVNKRFVGLHHHDEFSIKDGLGTVDKMLKLLKAQRQSFCCITNHGSVGGWIKQYNACKKAKIKAIFGCEVYTSPYRGDDIEERKKHRSANHLVLIAKTMEGFENIIKIHNDAQINGFYYSPRADREAFKKWGKGIIASSACFLPGTLVQTDKGVVEIEGVGSEDLMLTHSGKWATPIKTSRHYDGIIKTVSTGMFGFDTTSTDDHEFLVVKSKNQNRNMSDRILSEQLYINAPQMATVDRRRTFKSEWTSNIECGDWMLYPVDNRILDVEYLDLSRFNRGRVVEKTVSVSDQGRNILKKGRRKCGKTVKDIGFQKCSIYRWEKCNCPVRLSVLEKYLNKIGLNAKEFIDSHCGKLMSADISPLRNPINGTIRVDPDFLFLLGSYCAEGSSSRFGVAWTVNSNETNFQEMIKNAVEKCFGVVARINIRDENNRADIVCCSTAMATAMESLCGIGAEGKIIPDFIFGLPFEKQQHFIRGLIMGDGSYYNRIREYGSRTGNDKIVFVSVSEKLAQGLTRLLLRKNIVPSCWTSRARVDKNGTNHLKSFYISISGKQALPVVDFIYKGKESIVFESDMYCRKNIPVRINGVDYFTAKVKTVRKSGYVGEVRCLSVSGDNSFIAGMSVVHNCMAGELSRMLMVGDKEQAKELYEFYKGCFDEFYVEIQIIEYEAQREANRRLIEFAKSVGAPLLLTCDSHYLEAEHTETHTILMCIKQHKTLFDEKGEENEDVWSFDVKNMYYRNAEEMRQVFENGFVNNEGVECAPFKDDIFTEEVFVEAMLNTRKVAVSTEDIKLDSTVKLPKLYEDGKSILRKKVNEGFKARGLDKKLNATEYLDRAKREFDVITKLGWTDYFLIIEMIVTDAKKEHGEWACGMGRGSAGGSLVSFVLGITDVDPIVYGLLFERFLDQSRVSPPDIDCDFDPNIREKVKLGIVSKFGSDHVCSIGTYQTYRTRAVILDVAGALGEDKHEAMEVTKKIDPMESFEDDEGEEKKVDKIPFDELCEHYPELKTYFDNHPAVRHHAEILRNQVKNMGTHAGGVIISDLPLNDKIPVLYDKPGSDERKVISAWAEAGGNEELSSVGLVKFDILGLNNLPIIKDCIALVEKTKGIKIRRKDIPIDDRTSINHGSKKDLMGIFQLDNPSTKPVVDRVELESLNDVAAVTSLIRPGPRDMKMDIEYAERKHGKDYTMPEIVKNLLAETYGVVTYQEQAQKISQVIGGLSPTDSYKFLKAISKKQKDLMASFKDRFVKGSQKIVEDGQMTPQDIEDLWNTLAAFAEYAFCKAHAIAYSAISTVELWLKYHYRTEYLTALINNTKLGKKKHGEDIFISYLSYARKNGIEVLKPDISKSKNAFTIDDGKILFSLGHIKNVASMAEVIESFQPFTSIEDFHERVKIESVAASGKKTSRRPNKGVVESLIESGAFDCFGTRNEVVTEYYRVRDTKKDVVPQHTDSEWIELEKEVLGLCLSLPPLYKQYEKVISEKKWHLVSEVDNYSKVTMFGKIESITPKTSKTGNSMYIVKATDGLQSLSFFVFRGGQQKFKDHFKIGSIGGIPLDKFKDGDARFFNDRGECLLLSSSTNATPTTQVKSTIREVKKFPDGATIVFDRVNSNNFCIYCVSEKEKCVLKDSDYLEALGEMSKAHDPMKIYNDLLELCEATTKDISPELAAWITIISKEYGEDCEVIDMLFTMAYASMIAEENKFGSKLGKGAKLVEIQKVLVGTEKQ